MWFALSGEHQGMGVGFRAATFAQCSLKKCNSKVKMIVSYYLIVAVVTFSLYLEKKDQTR